MELPMLLGFLGLLFVNVASKKLLKIEGRLKGNISTSQGTSRLLALSPKAIKSMSVGRSSDLLLSVEAFPVANQWRVSHEMFGAYSSGNCSGFTPDSLLIQKAGTNFVAKVEI